MAHRKVIVQIVVDSSAFQKSIEEIIEIIGLPPEEDPDDG